MRRLVPACLVTALAAASFASAAPYDQMDYGPFISATFVAPWPKGNLSHRGIAVRFEARVPGEQPVEIRSGKKITMSDPGHCGVVFAPHFLPYPPPWPAV